MMTFERFHEENILLFEKELNTFLDEFSQRCNNQPRIKPLFSSFIKANKNGKRIRGLLILLGFTLSGKTITKEVLKLAALYEIIQTGLLIHDDIIDRSESRRGEKSVFAEFGRDHFAISQGISLGDLGFFFSESMLSEIEFSYEIRNALHKELNSILSQTAVGQLLDVSFSKSPRPTEEEIIAMMHYKTAVYTFIGPLKLGMIASGEPPFLGLESFGKNLGIAFQLQDDLFGVFGEEQDIGKSNISDIQEGKNTLLYLYARKKCDSKTREWLDDMYGNDSLTNDDIKRIKQIFEKYARTSVETITDSYFQNAGRDLDSLELRREEYELVDSFVSYVKTRKK